MEHCIQVLPDLPVSGWSLSSVIFNMEMTVPALSGWGMSECDITVFHMRKLGSCKDCSKSRGPVWAAHEEIPAPSSAHVPREPCEFVKPEVPLLRQKLKARSGGRKGPWEPNWDWDGWCYFIKNPKDQRHLSRGQGHWSPRDGTSELCKMRPWKSDQEKPETPGQGPELRVSRET